MPSKQNYFPLPYVFRSCFKALNLTVVVFFLHSATSTCAALIQETQGSLSFSIPFDKLYTLILYFKLNSVLF